MSWSNKKEAYDDGFDDGFWLAVGVCVGTASLVLYVLLFAWVVGVIG